MQIGCILQKLAMMSSTTTTLAATEASSSLSPPADYLDCPVERDVLGRHSWTLLHTMAANVPDKPTRDEQKQLTQFMTTLSNFYPCGFCAEELKELCVNELKRLSFSRCTFLPRDAL